MPKKKARTVSQEMKKRPGKPSEKTDAELQKEHVERVEKAVERINRAYDLLGRSMKSRRYPFTDDQKTMVINHLVDTHRRFVDKITAQKVSETAFKIQ